MLGVLMIYMVFLLFMVWVGAPGTLVYSPLGSTSSHEWRFTESYGVSVEGVEAPSRFFSFRILGDVEDYGWFDPYYRLAAYWAPVIRQYVKNDSTYGYRQDYITCFDYDTNWTGNDNWDNLPYYLDALYGYVYYSVVETETHYFIHYMFFHPRDWGRAWFSLVPDEHENDMEGILLVIFKNGSDYGSPLVMVTRAHTDFYQYSADPNVSDGVADDVDGSIVFDGWRPVVYVEAQGHGVYGDEGRVDQYYSYDDVIIYRFNGNISEHPDYSDQNNISYALLPIIRILWPKALNASFIGDGRMYDQVFNYVNPRLNFSIDVPASFDGDDSTDGGTDKANPPWGMHDSDYDDDGLVQGDWFFDPANFTRTLFSIPYEFSLNYTYNPYVSGEDPEFVPPDIQIISPSSGEYVNSSVVNISWIVNDSSSLYTLKVSVDGETTYEGRDEGYGSMIVNIDDGKHEVNITAVDIWGNYRWICREFYVDTVKPHLMVLRPENNSESLYNSTVYVEWNGSDNIGIDHFEVKTDNGSWSNVYKNTSIALHNLSLYNHTVWIRAIDLAGNIEMVSIIFCLNPSKPVLTNGDNDSDIAIMSSSDIYLSWHVEGDYDHVEIIVDNTTTINVGHRESYLLRGLSEGIHNVTIRVVYPSKEYVEETYRVMVDRTPPTIESESILKLSHGENNLSIRWDGNDELSGIEHYELLLPSGEWVFLGNRTEYTLDTSSMDDGTYLIVIRAFDAVGNYGQKPIIIIIDRTPPTVEITYPLNNTFLSYSDIPIIINATDMSMLSRMEIYLNESLIINTTFTPSYLLEGLKDGVYIVKIRVYDLCGNWAEDAVTIHIDTDPPKLSIVSPRDLETIYLNNITVEWEGEGTVDYYVRLDDDQWIFVGSEMSYTFNNVPIGIHTIYVMGIDRAGNRAMCQVIVIVEQQGSSQKLDEGHTSNRLNIKTNMGNIANITRYQHPSHRRSNDGKAINTPQNEVIVNNQVDIGDIRNQHLSPSGSGIIHNKFQLRFCVLLRTPSYTGRNNPNIIVDIVYPRYIYIIGSTVLQGDDIT